MNKGINQLLKVMRDLRSEKGCPWDKKQTMETLLPYTQEESWELADAILSGDKTHITEELGDLLFQVVFYSRIAEEEGWGSFDQVAEDTAKKLTGRHPHVFADEKWDTDKQRLAAWEKIKRTEKQANKSQPQTLLEDIPTILPPLLKAKKIQKRAASIGFDWDDYKPVLDKVDEELEELKQALDSDDKSHIEEEFGDLLFALVNLGRHLKIDPGIALEKCNGKFKHRFLHIETSLLKNGSSLEQASLDEMEALWQQAKK